jgi:hypothetical protein
LRSLLVSNGIFSITHVAGMKRQSVLRPLELRMNLQMKAIGIFVCASALTLVGVSQQPVPPPPKPADSGPSLAVTLQFIQDRMNDQGTVGFVSTRSDLSATFRNFYTISDVVTDPSACTMQKVETTKIKIEVADGITYNEGGKPVTGIDLIRLSKATSTIHLRDVDSIRVESLQDRNNQHWAEAARPEVSVTVVPPIYTLTLVSSKPVFKFHVTSMKGAEAPVERDTSGKLDSLNFRDEETANKLAKAFTRAVELCGGGNKDPF